MSKAVPSMSWAEVWARRLHRHALSVPSKDARPAEIVATICGAHAQLLSAAELSVGLRLAEGTRKDVQHALWVEHSLIKTFGPRGTVHLLPAPDLAMWTGALSAIPHTSPFSQDVRLTPEQTDAVVEAIASVLADAELTIDELSAAVVAATGSWAGDLVMPAFQVMWPRWRQVVDVAANRGALCFGPNRGRNVTYTNPRRWLPAFRPADTQTALAAVVRRYLYAYGPATPRHFARWLAAPAPWATQVFEALASELQEVDVEGTRAWVVAGDTAMPSAAPRGVRLLPYFDAYVVGCQPRELLFPGRAFARATANGQAGNYPVLLIDGLVAGVWHQRRAGRRIAITVEPLEALTAAQRGLLDEQVARVGVILEGTPELTLGAVNVGPHA